MEQGAGRIYNVQWSIAGMTWHVEKEVTPTCLTVQYVSIYQIAGNVRRSSGR